MFVCPPTLRHLAGFRHVPSTTDRRRARRPQDRTRARFRLEGLEDRCLLSITEFPVSTANSSLSAVTAGPDGNLWFLEQNANKIGMINLTTHAVSEFPITTANSDPVGIAAGPDGNLWFTEQLASKIGMINPTTEAITEFPTPTANSHPQGITVGPDGNLWFAESGNLPTTAGRIGTINPTTHAIREFDLPENSIPRWIAKGPDGNLWFTDYGLKSIGMIDPTTHSVSEFAVPPWTTSFAPTLLGITAGPDGNLWFAMNTYGASGTIGMINPTTQAISEYPLADEPGPNGSVTAGPDGNVWFTEGDNLATINPTNDAITLYPVPYTNAVPTGIASGPDRNMWFADYGTNSIGVDTLSTTHFVLTQPPPAGVTAGAPFGLTVEADDSSGDLDSSFSGTVTVALANNPGSATLAWIPTEGKTG